MGIFGMTNITMKGLVILWFNPSDNPVIDSLNGEEGSMNLMAELNANAKGYKLVSNGGGDSCYL
jgi:hypothetical protein